MKKLLVATLLAVLILGIVYATRFRMARLSQVSVEKTKADIIYLINTDREKGRYVTDFQGWTLYTNGNDNGTGEYFGSKSRVPYIYGAKTDIILPSSLTVITRKNGSKEFKQFAWKGMPLYGYIKDKRPGNITGEFGDWHIINP